MRLARRDVRPGWGERPGRLRQSRGLWRPVEPEKPGGEVCVTPSQRLQQRFLAIVQIQIHGGKIYLSALINGCRTLAGHPWYAPPRYGVGSVLLTECLEMPAFSVQAGRNSRQVGGAGQGIGIAPPIVSVVLLRTSRGGFIFC